VRSRADEPEYRLVCARSPSHDEGVVGRRIVGRKHGSQISGEQSRLLRISAMAKVDVGKPLTVSLAAIERHHARNLVERYDERCYALVNPCRDLDRNL
jgi:hypothetical protein